MMENKTNLKIIALLSFLINIFLVFQSIFLFYSYNFTKKLFLFEYSSWVLIANFSLGLIGIYFTVLLYEEKIKMKLFLIIMLFILLFVFLSWR